jgi:hypothetical protein
MTKSTKTTKTVEEIMAANPCEDGQRERVQAPGSVLAHWCADVAAKASAAKARAAWLEACNEADVDPVAFESATLGALDKTMALDEIWEQIERARNGYKPTAKYYEFLTQQILELKFDEHLQESEVTL